MSVYHGGNSDDLVSLSAMTGTVAVRFFEFILLDYKQLLLEDRCLDQIFAK